MAGVAMMVRDKYAVRLAQEQREELQRLIRVGKNSARVTASTQSTRFWDLFKKGAN